MTWPTVTEHPLRLEPTSRDPFLDGLVDELAWREPSMTRDPMRSPLRRRALALGAADVATRASACVPGTARS
jgi:hypothetical protein